MFSAAFGWNILFIALKSVCSNVTFKARISLLIFCLDGLSIEVSEWLKSPTITVSLSIYTFMFLNIWFIYLGTPILSTYIFTVVMSSWIDALVIMKCPSLFLVAAFVLNSIFSDIRIATLSFPFHVHGVPFFIS